MADFFGDPLAKSDPFFGGDADNPYERPVDSPANRSYGYQNSSGIPTLTEQPYTGFQMDGQQPDVDYTPSVQPAAEPQGNLLSDPMDERGPTAFQEKKVNWADSGWETRPKVYDVPDQDFLEVDYEYGKKNGPSDEPIRAANVFGRQYTADDLSRDEEGRKLMELMRVRRNGGYNKGGTLANLGRGLTDWTYTDIPFYGWIADIGMTAKDAADVSRTMRKLQDGEKITTHEGLKASRFLLQQELESTHTMAYNVGSTTRQMIGFMAEMWATAAIGAAIGAAGGGGVGAIPGAIIGAAITPLRTLLTLVRGGTKLGAKKVIRDSMATIARKAAKDITESDIAAVMAESAKFYGKAGSRSAMAEMMWKTRAAMPKATRADIRREAARKVADNLGTAVINQNREIGSAAVSALVGGDAQIALNSGVTRAAESFLLKEAGITAERLAAVEGNTRAYDRLVRSAWKQVTGKSRDKWNAFRADLEKQLAKGITGLNGSTVGAGMVKEAMEKTTGEFVNMNFAKAATRMAMNDSLRTLELKLGTGAAMNPVRFFRYLGRHVTRGLMQTEGSWIAGGSATSAHAGMTAFHRSSDALAEAIGRVFVEAPVRAAVQLGLSQTITAPMFSVMHGMSPTDVAFRGQLGFQAKALMTGDRDMMDSARLAAAGSMFVEYMSENAGRGLGGLVGGTIGTIAGKSTQKLSAGVTSAKNAIVSSVLNRESGSVLSRAVDAVWGTGDLSKVGVDKLASGARAFLTRKLSKGTADSITDLELRNIMTNLSFKGVSPATVSALNAAGVKTARQLQNRVFAEEINVGGRLAVGRAAIGAALMRRGWTPDKIISTFRQAGYGGILEEMGEERLGDFVRGLFGADDTSSNADVSEKLKSMFSGFLDPEQLATEFLSFAFPGAVRSATFHTQRWLANGMLGRTKDAVSRTVNLQRMISTAGPFVTAEVADARHAEALASHADAVEAARVAAYGNKADNVAAVTSKASDVWARRSEIEKMLSSGADSLPGVVQGALSGVAGAADEAHMKTQLQEFMESFMSFDSQQELDAALAASKAADFLGEEAVSAIRREWAQVPGHQLDSSDPIEAKAAEYRKLRESTPSVGDISSASDGAAALYAQMPVAGADQSITADVEDRQRGPRGATRTVSADILDSATADAMEITGNIARVAFLNDGKMSRSRRALSWFVGALGAVTTGDLSLIASNPSAWIANDMGMDRNLVNNGLMAYNMSLVAGYRKIRETLSAELKATLDDSLSRGGFMQSLREAKLDAPTFDAIEKAGRATFEEMTRAYMQSFLAGQGVIAVTHDAARSIAEQVVRSRRASGSSESTDLDKVHTEVVNGVMALASNGLVYNTGSMYHSGNTFMTVDVARACASGTKAEVLAAILAAPAFRSLSRTVNVSGQTELTNPIALSMATAQAADLDRLLKIDETTSSDLTEDELGVVADVFGREIFNHPLTETQKLAKQYISMLRLSTESTMRRFDDLTGAGRRAYVVPGKAADGSRVYSARVISADGTSVDSGFVTSKLAGAYLEENGFGERHRNIVVSSMKDFVSADATSMVLFIAGNDRELARSMFLNAMGVRSGGQTSDVGLREDELPPVLRKRTLNENGTRRTEWVYDDDSIQDAVSKFNEDLRLAAEARRNGTRKELDWRNYAGATEEEKKDRMARAAAALHAVYGGAVSGEKSKTGYENLAAEVLRGHNISRNTSAGLDLTTIGVPSDAWRVSPSSLTLADTVVLTPDYATLGHGEALLRNGLRTAIETHLAAGGPDAADLGRMYAEAARMFVECARQIAAEVRPHDAAKADRIMNAVTSTVPVTSAGVGTSAIAAVASASVFFSCERGIRDEGNGFLYAPELARVADRFRGTAIYPIFYSALDEATGGTGLFRTAPGQSATGLARFLHVFGADPGRIAEGRRSAVFTDNDAKPLDPFMPVLSLAPGATKDMITGRAGSVPMTFSAAERMNGFGGDIRGYAARMSQGCSAFAKEYLSVAGDGRDSMSAAEVYRLAKHADLLGGTPAASPKASVGAGVVSRRSQKATDNVRSPLEPGKMSERDLKVFAASLRGIYDMMPAGIGVDRAIETFLRNSGMGAGDILDIMTAFNETEVDVTRTDSDDSPFADGSAELARAAEQADADAQTSAGAGVENAWAAKNEAAVGNNADLAAISSVFRWTFQEWGGNVAATLQSLKDGFFAGDSLKRAAENLDLRTGEWTRTADQIKASVDKFLRAIDPVTYIEGAAEASAHSPFQNLSDSDMAELVSDVVRALVWTGRLPEALTLQAMNTVPFRDGRRRNVFEMFATMFPCDGMSVVRDASGDFSIETLGSVRESDRTASSLATSYTRMLGSGALRRALASKGALQVSATASAIADLVDRIRHDDFDMTGVFSVKGSWNELKAGGWPTDKTTGTPLVLADTAAESEELYRILRDKPDRASYEAAVDRLVATVRSRAASVAEAVRRAVGDHSLARAFTAGSMYARLRSMAVAAYDRSGKTQDRMRDEALGTLMQLANYFTAAPGLSNKLGGNWQLWRTSQAFADAVEEPVEALAVRLGMHVRGAGGSAMDEFGSLEGDTAARVRSQRRETAVATLVKGLSAIKSAAVGDAATAIPRELSRMLDTAARVKAQWGTHIDLGATHDESLAAQRSGSTSVTVARPVLSKVLDNLIASGASSSRSISGHLESSAEVQKARSATTLPTALPAYLRACASDLFRKFGATEELKRNRGLWDDGSSPVVSIIGAKDANGSVYDKAALAGIMVRAIDKEMSSGVRRGSYLFPLFRGDKMSCFAVQIPARLVHKMIDGAIADTKFMEGLPQSVKEALNAVAAERRARDGAVQPAGSTTGFRCHSGAASGSDTLWGNVAERFGVPTSHYRRDADRGKDGTSEPLGKSGLQRKVHLSEKQFDEGLEHYAVAAKGIGRALTKQESGLGLMARNWFQVKNSDAVFAVSRGFSGNNVLGGTGYAVQMAKDAGKPIHVYDYKSGKWFSWTDGKWTEEPTPTLTKNFAGIGSRDIAKLPAEEQAKVEAAVVAVFEKTFGKSEADVEEDRKAAADDAAKLYSAAYGLVAHATGQSQIDAKRVQTTLSVGTMISAYSEDGSGSVPENAGMYVISRIGGATGTQLTGSYFLHGRMPSVVSKLTNGSGNVGVQKLHIYDPQGSVTMKKGQGYAFGLGYKASDLVPSQRWMRLVQAAGRRDVESLLGLERMSLDVPVRTETMTDEEFSALEAAHAAAEKAADEFFEHSTYMFDDGETNKAGTFGSRAGAYTGTGDGAVDSISVAGHEILVRSGDKWVPSAEAAAFPAIGTLLDEMKNDQAPLMYLAAAAAFIAGKDITSDEIMGSVGSWRRPDGTVFSGKLGESGLFPEGDQLSVGWDPEVGVASVKWRTRSLVGQVVANNSNPSRPSDGHPFPINATRDEEVLEALGNLGRAVRQKEHRFTNACSAFTALQLAVLEHNPQIFREALSSDQDLVRQYREHPDDLGVIEAVASKARTFYANQVLPDFTGTHGAMTPSSVNGHVLIDDSRFDHTARLDRVPGATEYDLDMLRPAEPVGHSDRRIIGMDRTWPSGLVDTTSKTFRYGLHVDAAKLNAMWEGSALKGAELADEVPSWLSADADTARRLARLVAAARKDAKVKAELLKCLVSHTGESADKLWNAKTIAFDDLFFGPADGSSERFDYAAVTVRKMHDGKTDALFVGGSHFIAHRSPSGNGEAFSGVVRASAPVLYGRGGKPGPESVYTLDGITMFTQGSDTDGDSAGVQVREDDVENPVPPSVLSSIVRAVNSGADVMRLAAEAGLIETKGGVDVLRPGVLESVRRELFDAQVAAYRSFPLFHQGYMSEDIRSELLRQRREWVESDDERAADVANHADDVFEAYEFAELYAARPELLSGKRLYDLGFAGRQPVGTDPVFEEPVTEASRARILGMLGPKLSGRFSDAIKVGSKMNKVFSGIVDSFEPAGPVEISSLDVGGKMSDAAADSAGARGVSVKYQSRILRAAIARFGLANLVLRDESGYSPLLDLTSHNDGVSNNLFDTLKKMFATRAGWYKRSLPFFVTMVALDANELIGRDPKGARLDSAFYLAEAIKFLDATRNGPMERYLRWTHPVDGPREFAKDCGLKHEDVGAMIREYASKHDKAERSAGGESYFNGAIRGGVWAVAKEDGTPYSRASKLAMVACVESGIGIDDAVGHWMLRAQDLVDTVEGYNLMVDLPMRIPDSAPDARRHERARDTSTELARRGGVRTPGNEEPAGMVTLSPEASAQNLLGDRVNDIVSNLSRSYDRVEVDVGELIDDIVDDGSDYGRPMPTSESGQTTVARDIMKSRLDGGTVLAYDDADVDALRAAVFGVVRDETMTFAGVTGEHKTQVRHKNPLFGEKRIDKDTYITSAAFANGARGVELRENLDRLVHLVGLQGKMRPPAWMGDSVDSFVDNLVEVVGHVSRKYAGTVSHTSPARDHLLAFLSANRTSKEISFAMAKTARDLSSMKAAFSEMLSDNGVAISGVTVGGQSHDVTFSELARSLMFYAGMTKPYGATLDYVGRSSLPAVFPDATVSGLERYRAGIVSHPAMLLLAAMKPVPVRDTSMKAFDIFNPVVQDVIQRLAGNRSFRRDRYPVSSAEETLSAAWAPEDAHVKKLLGTSGEYRRADGETVAVYITSDKGNRPAKEAERTMATLSDEEARLCRPMGTFTYVGMESAGKRFPMENVFAMPYLDEKGRMKFGGAGKRYEGAMYLEDAVNAAMKLRAQKTLSDPNALARANAWSDVNPLLSEKGVFYRTVEQRAGLVHRILAETVRRAPVSTANAVISMARSAAGYAIRHDDEGIARGFATLVDEVDSGAVTDRVRRDTPKASVASALGGDSMDVGDATRLDFGARVEQMFPGLRAREVNESIPQAIERALTSAFGSSVSVTPVVRDGAKTSMLKVVRDVKTDSGSRKIITYISVGDFLGKDISTGDMVESTLAEVNRRRRESGKPELTEADVRRLTGGKLDGLVGLLRASGSVRGQSTSGVSLGFAPAMSGLVQLSVNAGYDTLFHEYYHQMVACYKRLGVLTSAEETALNKAFGGEEEAANAYARFLVGAESGKLLREYREGDVDSEKVFTRLRAVSAAIAASLHSGPGDDASGMPTFIQATMVLGDLSGYRVDGDFSAPSANALEAFENVLLGEKDVFSPPVKMSAEDHGKTVEAGLKTLERLEAGESAEDLVDGFLAVAGHASAQDTGDVVTDEPAVTPAPAGKRDVVDSVSKFLSLAVSHYKYQPSAAQLRAKMQMLAASPLDGEQDADPEISHTVFSVRQLLRQVAILEGFDTETDGELNETGRRLLSDENVSLLALRLLANAQREHEITYRSSDQASAAHGSAFYAVARALETMAPNAYVNHAKTLSRKAAESFRAVADNLSAAADRARDEGRADDEKRLRASASDLYETARLVPVYAEAMALGRDLHCFLADPNDARGAKNSGNLHGLFVAVVTGRASFYNKDGDNVSLSPSGIRKYAPGTTSLHVDMSDPMVRAGFDYAAQAFFTSQAARSYAVQCTGIGRTEAETEDIRTRNESGAVGIGSETTAEPSAEDQADVARDIEEGLGPTAGIGEKFQPMVPDSWYEAVDMSDKTPGWILSNPGLWLKSDMMRNLSGRSLRDLMTDHSIQAVLEAKRRLASDFAQFFGFDAYRGQGVRKISYDKSRFGRNGDGDFAISDDYVHTVTNYATTNGYMFGIFTTGEDRVGELSGDDLRDLNFLAGQAIKAMVGGDDRIVTGIRVKRLVEFDGAAGASRLAAPTYAEYYSMERVLRRYDGVKGEDNFTQLDNVIKRMHEELPPAIADSFCAEFLGRLHDAAERFLQAAQEAAMNGDDFDANVNAWLSAALTNEYRVVTERKKGPDGRLVTTKRVEYVKPLVTRGRNGDRYVSVQVSDCLRAWDRCGARQTLVEAGRPPRLLNLHYWANKFRKAALDINNTAAKSPFLSAGAGSNFTSAGQSKFWWHEGAGARAYNVDRHQTAVEAFRDLPQSTKEEIEKEQNRLFGHIENFKPSVLSLRAFGTAGTTPLTNALITRLKDMLGAKDMEDHAFIRAVASGSFADAPYPVMPNATVMHVVQLVARAESEENFAEIAASKGLPTAEKRRLMNVRAAIDRVMDNLKDDVPGFVNCRSELDEFRFGSGKLGQATTAPEALMQMCNDVVAAERFRGCLAQMLSNVSSDGMPLFIVSPTDAMVSVNRMPDEYWGALARHVISRARTKLSDVIPYDDGLSGVENMRRVHRFFAALKETSEDKGRRGMYTELPAAKHMVGDMFEGDILCYADVRDSAGNVNMLTAAQGGEAACYMKQLLATLRAPTNNAAWRVLDSLCSWNKLASVGFSAFFQIATVIESPTAAAGFWHTFMGTSKATANLARRIGKAAGRKGGTGAFSEDAVFMADFREMINSDDPFVVEIRELCDLIGMPLEQTVPFVNEDNPSNPVLGHAGTVQEQIKKISAMAEMGGRNPRLAKTVRKTLDYLYRHPTDYTFNVVLNGVKMAVVAQTMRRLREECRYQNRPFDPVKELRKYSTYINAEIGGLDPAQFAWATPFMRKVLSNSMFSWQWTVGAWIAGGGSALSDIMFGGHGSTPESRQWTFIRWLRMLGIVKFGIPVVLHAAIKGLSKALKHVLPPDPDEKMGDEADAEIDEMPWLAWNNESKAGALSFDITPLIKLFRRVPGAVALKDAGIPVVSSMVPAYVGGGRNSTGKRRYYMHFGKQSDEFFRWFDEPLDQATAKTSPWMQKVLEGFTGGSLQTNGFAKAFAEKSMLERWLNLNVADADNSALGNLVQGFILPFSMQSMAANPDAGVLTWIGPTKMGQSNRSTRLRIVDRLTEFVEDDRTNNPWSYRRNRRKLNLMCMDILREGQLNGVNPEKIMTSALGDVAKIQYNRIMAALPKNANSNEIDVPAVMSAVRALYRINRKLNDIEQSISQRYEKAGVDYGKSRAFRSMLHEVIRVTGASPTLSDEDVRKRALDVWRSHSEKATEMADKAGENFGNFLATDKVPETLFGIPVVASGHTEEDLQFFREHPEAGGYYDLGDE